MGIIRSFCFDFLYTCGRREPFFHETQTSTGTIFLLTYFYGGGVVKLAIAKPERLFFMHLLTLEYPDSLIGSYQRFFFLLPVAEESLSCMRQRPPQAKYIFSHIFLSGGWLISHYTSGTTMFNALLHVYPTAIILYFTYFYGGIV